MTIDPDVSGYEQLQLLKALWRLNEISGFFVVICLFRNGAGRISQDYADS